jgi:hypothetical protein
MTNRFMISVAAAALIAGTGFAHAQGTGMGREGSSGGSTVQQSAPSSDRAAPSSSATPMNRSDDSKGSAAKTTQSDEKPAAKTTQSDEKMQPGGAKNQRAQDDTKAGPKGEKSAQDNNMKGEKSKSMSSETNEKGGAAKDMKAEGRNGNMNAEQKSTTDTRSQTTTGQAGAGAKLSGEQRTKITTVIRGEHVAPVNNVNFSISVGTRVPREGVSFHPLPAEVVTIYPEWRGYEYFLVNDRIVVVDPRTLEIVDVIDV